LAITLNEKLSGDAILEKDIFFYSCADLICSAVKTYVIIAQKGIDKGYVIRVKMDKVYQDLGLSVVNSKVLPENCEDMNNSLSFLKQIMIN